MTTTVEFGPWAQRLADPSELNRYLAYKVREDADPFVPYQSGNLAGDGVSFVETSEMTTIVYSAPYAHYVWVGEAMGGSAPRHYTGETLNYFHGMHSQAGADWTERAADANMSGWEQLIAGRLLA
ncbi:minor capsid protein [Lacticaseibacillus suilingensis]|uniref:minor capsid protein n=1 Tax=Lacticaseibacillus suilingensis TaxID=2799577 RepID=UPI0022E7467A|nr:minor capsid protein [Lacticaseibacillus suilingensis]